MATQLKQRRSRKSQTAIEDPAFPFEQLSDIAELESWRKEINRPIYHIHKWWAQRLGSVFRAVLLAAFSPPDTDILTAFYTRRKSSTQVVFDPFMGSGTTVGEAIKLGFRAIGQDINPVSHFLVKNALAAHSRSKVLQEFEAIEADTAPALRHFYQTRIATGLFPDGLPAEVLYYFWVKVLACPACGQDVDLFSSYIFSQHAYPKRYPSCKALCPGCGAINTVNYDTQRATCVECRASFNPGSGPAQGQTARCPQCREGRRGYVHLAVSDEDVTVAAEAAEALVLVDVVVTGVQEIAVADDQIEDRVLVLAALRMPPEDVVDRATVMETRANLAVTVEARPAIAWKRQSLEFKADRGGDLPKVGVGESARWVVIQAETREPADEPVLEVELLVRAVGALDEYAVHDGLVAIGEDVQH